MKYDLPFSLVVQKLRDELNSRKRKNPAYSIRSFARDLGISKTTLAAILSEKRQASKKTLALIFDALPELFEHEIDVSTIKGIRKVDSEDFDPIRNWYYLAIFHLADFPGNQASPNWISEKLNLPLEKSTKGLNTLVRLNFIKIQDGRMKRIARSLETKSTIGSQAIRDHHKEKLNQAINALDKIEPQKREFASLTLPTNKKFLPEIKDMVSEFVRRVQLQYGTYSPDEIYNVSVQLFPMRGSLD